MLADVHLATDFGALMRRKESAIIYQSALRQFKTVLRPYVVSQRFP
jgi:hypothetical protein